MSKRPAFNLSDLTSEAAAPMAEAMQRSATPTPIPAPVAVTLAAVETALPPTQSAQPPKVGAVKTRLAPERTENLEGLSFKVPKDFRKRFRKLAANHDLKLNALLFEALDAWEEKQKRK